MTPQERKTWQDEAERKGREYAEQSRREQSARFEQYWGEKARAIAKANPVAQRGLFDE